MAAVLSFAELVAYGDELCGRYVFDDREKRGMRKRATSLTTVNQLEGYLASAQGCYGRKAAFRALPYIVDGSASPMETLDEMLLCLPYRYGGYGVEKPVMNYDVELDERLAAFADRDNCYADLCWPDAGLCIEHQGAFDHNKALSFESDRARVNALTFLGYEVVELTHGQVSNLYAFEEIAVHVAKALGKRLDGAKLGPTVERLALRRSLFAWNIRSGRPAC